MAQINIYISEAIQKIESDKQRAVQIAKERVQIDKIRLHNEEVDQYKNKALAELQQKYEQDRADIIKKSEDNKNEFANNEIETAIAVEVAIYDAKIEELKKLLIKE